MLELSVVDLVKELHGIGQQLAVLKRLYQTYGTIIRRILERQRLLRGETKFGEVKNLGLSSELSFSNVESWDSQPLALRPVGLLLSSPAIAYFERLCDRIDLYCLVEIENCISEKDSLTFLVSDLPHYQ